ncbi:MAG TPA: 16S rRNA (guanine(527)-N(7))-methyltransferase RsmG [Candidatus Sulfotelmatobacter sp.]|nr:16S rRNA (guanine(527)-N(7))-methyltransferase RsmG [Candidatus Sulfotelmatobacter sp.]
MHPARIAELLQPFVGVPAAISSAPCHSEPAQAGEEPAVLSPAQLQYISTYIDILLRWNARINLTAIRDPEEIVTRHFGESLFASRHLFPKEAHVGYRGRAALQGRVTRTEEIGALAPGVITLADLGSGAGFPGVPIKLWAPHISLTLIESNQKKVAFLREIVRALTLTNVNVFSGRAEHLLGGPHTNHTHPKRDHNLDRQTSRKTEDQPPRGFDLVTLRAVERFANVLPVAASLVAPGGRLALLIGTSQLAQVQTTLAGISWEPAQAVPISQSRTLLVGRLS